LKVILRWFPSTAVSVLLNRSSKKSYTAWSNCFTPSYVMKNPKLEHQIARPTTMVHDIWIRWLCGLFSSLCTQNLTHYVSGLGFVPVFRTGVFQTKYFYIFIVYTVIKHELG